MRALVVVLFAVAGGCDADSPPLAPAPQAAARAEAAAPQRARDTCRDACEEQAILAHADDATLRRCRLQCDARYGVTAAPHQVPSRVTRAAPAHAPPAVRPR